MSPADFNFVHFALRSFVNLNETLQSFGMIDAFDRNRADFTGVNGANDLFLTAFSQINQLQISPSKSLLTRLNRQVAEVQHNHHHYVLKFERQFLYAIRHNPTGMITYLGRYYDPTV